MKIVATKRIAAVAFQKLQHRICRGSAHSVHAGYTSLNRCPFNRGLGACQCVAYTKTKSTFFSLSGHHLGGVSSLAMDHGTPESSSQTSRHSLRLQRYDCTPCVYSQLS